jgi:hypothetical protein
MMLLAPFGLSYGFFSDSVCGYAAATRYSPRGGRRRSRRDFENIIGAELSGTSRGLPPLQDARRPAA